MKLSRRSNPIICGVLLLVSISIVSGATAAAVKFLPLIKAQRGFSFWRLPRTARTLAEASEQTNKGDWNTVPGIFALTLFAGTLGLAWLFFRPGEIPVLRTMPEATAEIWGYDQSKTINPFDLTDLERRCLLSIVIAIPLAVAIFSSYGWYLSIS